MYPSHRERRATGLPASRDKIDRDHTYCVGTNKTTGPDPRLPAPHPASLSCARLDSVVAREAEAVPTDTTPSSSIIPGIGLPPRPAGPSQRMAPLPRSRSILPATDAIVTRHPDALRVEGIGRRCHYPAVQPAPRCNRERGGVPGIAPRADDCPSNCYPAALPRHDRTDQDDVGPRPAADPCLGNGRAVRS